MKSHASTSRLRGYVGRENDKVVARLHREVAKYAYESVKLLLLLYNIHLQDCTLLTALREFDGIGIVLLERLVEIRMGQVFQRVHALVQQAPIILHNSWLRAVLAVVVP